MDYLGSTDWILDYLGTATWIIEYLGASFQEMSLVGSTATVSLNSTLSDTCMPDQILYIMGYEKNRNVNYVLPTRRNNMTTIRQHVKIPLECLLYLIVLLETIRLIIVILLE